MVGCGLISGEVAASEVQKSLQMLRHDMLLPEDRALLDSLDTAQERYNTLVHMMRRGSITREVFEHEVEELKYVPGSFSIKNAGPSTPWPSLSLSAEDRAELDSLTALRDKYDMLLGLLDKGRISRRVFDLELDKMPVPFGLAPAAPVEYRSCAVPGFPEGVFISTHSQQAADDAARAWALVQAEYAAKERATYKPGERKFILEQNNEQSGL